MADQSPEVLTIGRLAAAAAVGIETIRYYQQRGLLPVPSTLGAYRYYPATLIERIRFIKRAQELGLSLDEITELLRLEDGSDRRSVRRIAAARLQQIETKLADLRRMQKTLKHLVSQCEHTSANLPCPIIATLVRPGPAGTPRTGPAAASRRQPGAPRAVPTDAGTGRSARALRKLGPA